MKRLIIILAILLSGFICSGQTFIEMMSPEDADVILLEVKDSTEADIIIYKTKSTKLANEWDCMWKIKKWGFSNFSLYVASDTTELYISKDDSYNEKSYIVKPHGKVYFTDKPEERMYRNPNFRLVGVMKINKYKE